MGFKMMRCALQCGLLASAQLFFASPGFSSELVYRPVNPSFGGNPLNSGHLQFLATTQNQFVEGRSTLRASPSATNADLFVRNLQSRLLSGLAAQVSDAIFGEDPAEQGRIVFGDTEVNFERGVEFIRLTINDPLSGLTEIQVPIFQTQ